MSMLPRPDRPHTGGADALLEGLDPEQREVAEALVLMLSPLAPHIAEELWSLLHPGGTRLVAELPWLEADPALLKADTLTLAVQVLGKLRGTIEVPADADEAVAPTSASSATGSPMRAADDLIAASDRRGPARAAGCR